MTEAHNKIIKSKMKTENIKMLIKYINKCYNSI